MNKTTNLSLKYASLFKLLLGIYIVFITIPKGNGLEWIITTVLLILSIYTIINDKLNDKFIYNKVFIFLMLLLFTQFISNLFSFDISDGLYNYRKVSLSILIVGLSIVLFRINITFEYLYKVFAISLLIIGLYYFYEGYMAYDTVNIFNENFKVIRDATFIIPVVLPFVLFGIYEFKNNKFLLLIAIFGIILNTIIMLYSGSRGALITLFGEFLFFLFFLLKRKKLIYMFLLVCFGGILLFMTSNKVVQSAIDRGLYYTDRESILIDLKEPMFNNLVMGIGQGLSNIANIVTQYDIDGVVNINHGYKVIGAHNSFIQILLESGIIAFILYILIIIVILYNFFKLIISKSSMPLWYLAICSIVVNHFIIRGFVESLNITIFYLIIFLYIALLNNFSENKSLDS